MPDKIERFTIHARQILRTAQEVASRLQHPFIESGHVLLALAKVDPEISGVILSDLGLDAGEIEPALIALHRDQSPVSIEMLDLSADTRTLLELAVTEARARGHTRIGAAHLLAGTANLTTGSASDILRGAGITAGDIRVRLKLLWSVNGQMFALTRIGAHFYHHPALTPEHLLAALVFGSSSPAACALRAAGLTPLRLETWLETLPAGSETGEVAANDRYPCKFAESLLTTGEKLDHWSADRRIPLDEWTLLQALLDQPVPAIQTLLQTSGLTASTLSRQLHDARQRHAAAQPAAGTWRPSHDKSELRLVVGITDAAAHRHLMHTYPTLHSRLSLLIREIRSLLGGQPSNRK